MRVRGQLVLAFSYILITVIVALEVPLAITLQRRALAELEARSLASAQTFAATIGAENLKNPATLQSQVDQYAKAVDGRVIVVDPSGILIADSAGPGLLGTNYDTVTRPEIQTALNNLQPETVVRSSESLHQDLLATAVPIIDEGKLQGALRITESMAEVTAKVRQAVGGLIAIGLAGLAAGLLIAFALAGSLAKPLTRLAGAAQRLGRGDLTTRAGDITGAREIEELANSFDDMAERLESAMRTQREFIANASHQLRTPLTGMKLRLESATDIAPNDEIRRQLEAAEREVDRLAAIVEHLMATATQIERAEKGGESTDLVAAAERAISRWQVKAEQHEATVSTAEEAGEGKVANAGDAAPVAAIDEKDVDQILDNLIDNAITYAPGRITVETGSSNGQVFLEVSDEGPGIAADDQEHLTERFFRGRGAPAGGSGLGLAIVNELTERWSGKLEVSSRPGAGTSMKIVLPRAGDGPLEAAPS